MVGSLAGALAVFYYSKYSKSRVKTKGGIPANLYVALTIFQALPQALYIS